MLQTQAPLYVPNVLPANRHTQVPRFWLIGYDENRQPLTPAEVRGWGASGATLRPGREPVARLLCQCELRAGCWSCAMPAAMCLPLESHE